MLGYESKDLDAMTYAVGKASKFIPSDKTSILKGLEDAEMFLKGLWAEGYFDQLRM